MALGSLRAYARELTMTPEGARPPFLWGVSTSSYQVEGAVREDGRGPSIWDVRCYLGKVDNHDTGDVACDHYHRYREDIGLMKALGVGAYRFSVAWPRLQPTGRGAVNPAGLAFYDRLIDGLLEAGIEPWLCLYHWDLPQALSDLGGWTNRDSHGWFADYATIVARRLGDRVTRFATFNEPSVFTLFGYAMDWGAPGLIDRDAHSRAIHHVNLAHGLALDAIRAQTPRASIGAIHNRQTILPETPGAANEAAAARLHDLWNLAFPEPQILGTYPPNLMPFLERSIQDGDLARIKRPNDWFGMNHYGPIYVRAAADTPWGFAWGNGPAEDSKTEIGWPVRAPMFRDELIETSRRYKLPVYVTENGYGSHDAPDAGGEIVDERRIAYLDRHISAMNEAIAMGADIRGYFVWSLLDNFEWGAGFANRFGLIYVDFATGERRIKASGRWFADMIAAQRR